ncbi:hypothetical protein KKF60_02320 [Patescibacteria group bacterium]|nr:hypothetical protein [Patescibacteria group bacterium]MBU4458703.1 hypothetical protein [Patescibacteria group bacterium]MCG2696298.1 hypothetical protein [Candidatus Portnoybacteria bacterium]
MTIQQIISYIGIPVMVGALIYIGRKLQILDKLEITSETIKHNIKVVCDFLTKKSSLHFDPKELKAYSPLNLTPQGNQFIKDLGFDNVFKEHKLDFFNYINGEEPKLKYDVELSAIKSIHFLSDKSYMDFLKVFFYNNPARNIDNMAPTLGVYIRDEYLKEHPEITQ